MDQSGQRHQSASRPRQQMLDTGDGQKSKAPLFDLGQLTNITALVGKTAYLTCRVQNLGDKTVSFTLTISEASLNFLFFSFLFLIKVARQLKRIVKSFLTKQSQSIAQADCNANSIRQSNKLKNLRFTNTEYSKTRSNFRRSFNSCRVYREIALAF